MRISTKGRYGLRLLLDIVLHQQDGPVALGDIARRQDISRKYLWQVVNPLKSAGLLHAVRGARGGYTLACEPETITVWDVINILEGSVSLVSCLDEPSHCDRCVSCATRRAWSEIDGKIKESMSGITLKDLIGWHNEAQGKQNINFII